MKAVHIKDFGGPSSVALVDVEPPAREAGEVLIDVHAAGVAFPEVLQTRGKYQVRPELPFVPGAEVAGVVAEAPAGSAVRAGDRVAALPFLGGFAEQAVCPLDATFPIPDSVTFEQAAAIPFNYLTAHFALCRRGRLAAGETVLVHGAAGGVGTAVIQVAKAFGAGTVLGVVSTPAKGEIAVAAGADAYVLADGFKESVREATAGRGVDLVADVVGGDRFTDSLRSLAADGRLLVIGFTAGAIPEVKVNRLLLNNLDVIGVGWGAYANARPGYLRAQWAELLPKLETGALRPHLGGTYTLGDVQTALAAIDNRSAVGKLVLRLRD
ncbi:NADPH:quinone oxidoreductase family protein [Amycolatopsis saalfeldensis]|uniref:NADPH2:quinone reductase n=1 Tax=Amycolatopsis saalfeldensis TaxID=394193 RepID=A0A1H8XCX3_9PSEU|nr:NADPH:quinone oxidoreductase family protein [Amycolatopsis saalfeldensis]SEP37683.1 NADPH2:quinone reductase [Amycolatopsis saalfeldensis]